MTVVPTPRQLRFAHHPGVDAPHPSGTGSAHALPMTPEEKEAVEARERNPVGFAPPSPRKRRRRKA